MGKRVSFADQVYDRFCQDHVLRAGSKDGALVLKKGLSEYRASGYEIEGLGRLVLLRETGLFGPKRELAWFIPSLKDAPAMRIASQNGSGKSVLDIQLPQAMLSPIRYQQFSRVQESLDRLQNAEAARDLAGAELLSGSVCKTGSNEELSAMLEEYLSTYLRVLDMAQPCDRAQKQEKIALLADLYAKNTDGRDLARVLAGGRETEEFIKKNIFALR